jgi:Tfp pilus assembly protein PilF
MKNSILLFVLMFISLCTFSQPGKKTAQKEKPPTAKEMEDMMKEAQKMLGEMSAEDKKMMDSLGIKMPSLNNVPKVTDQQLAEAWENENRIVPKRDATRIAAIPNAVTDARMPAYIVAVQKSVTIVLKTELVTKANKLYDYIQSKSKNSYDAGNMATGFWVAGQPEIALYILGRLCAKDASNTDNLNNYAAMLSMLDAPQLAIPILNNLNAKFPKNSTLLNNLGQAWFGLGEINKAEKYLDSVIRIYAYHPQANLTMAAIHESRGNADKAREAVKKSMIHSYTKDKEEKLVKLGEKITAKNFRLPRRTQNDPLNLGSFQAPGFPSSVDECILAEKEWIEFYRQVSSKYKQLEKLKKQADEKAVEGYQQRMNADLNLVKTAMANPGTTGQFVSVPMYAERAGKLLKAYTDLHQVKWQAFLKKAADFGKGEGKALKEAYDKEMEKLREEDDEQTGEGKPNKDFCPRYKEVSDKYLKAINPKLYQFYQEGLKLKKEFINENAYWYMYIQWPDMYEASKLGFQMGWLGALTEGKGDIDGPVYSFPFVSITQFVCKKQEKEPGKTKLKEFDDIACQYNSKVDYEVIVIESNCSHSRITYNLGDIKITRKELGEEYIGSTVKLTPKVSVGGQLGPIKIEGSVGTDVTAEVDKDNQVKEWGGTVTTGIEAGVGISKGPVKAGVTVSEAMEVEIGSKGIGDINMVTKAEASAGVKAGPIGKSVQIGVESRQSINSGHGHLTVSGPLAKATLWQW